MSLVSRYKKLHPDDQAVVIYLAGCAIAMIVYFIALIITVR